MEEETNNRRLLIAAGLCFAVMLLWNYISPPTRTKRPPSHPMAVATATASVAPTKTSTVVVAAEPTPDVPPEIFSFAGVVPGIEPSPAMPFEVQLTNVGGGIERFELTSFKERDRNNEKTDQNVSLATPSADAKDRFGQMAAISFGEGTTFALPERTIYKVAEKRPDFVRYLYTTKEGVEVEREYHFSESSFQMELAVTVRNKSARVQSHRLEMAAALAVSEAMEAGSGILSTFIPPPDHLSGVCHSKGSAERTAYAALAKGQKKSFKETVRWAAIDRQYFVAGIVPRDGTEVECKLEAHDHIARAAVVMPLETLKPGEERRHKFTAYLGVKKPALLTKVNAELEEAIDYTILGMDLAVLCAALLWVLSLFHSWVGSWGVAILGLTVLVKLMLFPLNQRSGKSMRAMSALKPQLDSLREKFPDDRQRQSEEMMKLYKEHNVSPAGGCLPVLLQMPIWLSLYRSLWVSVDLYQQGFLWIHDLTARDPYWILPGLLIVVMFVQQRMTPSTMDPAQQKIMQWTMPLVFGLMMLALPAGLCFYILVNTLLTIVQQHLINRSIGPIGGSASVQGAPA